MVNRYCQTCKHERNSIGFCDKCCYICADEGKGMAPTMYEKRTSNADRIRAMTDEEPFECPALSHPQRNVDCRKIWLDWLKQEVEDVSW